MSASEVILRPELETTETLEDESEKHPVENDKSKFHVYPPDSSILVCEYASIVREEEPPVGVGETPVVLSKIPLASNNVDTIPLKAKNEEG